MIPAAFAYQRATSVEDASRLLARGGDDAKVLAGGHSRINGIRLWPPATPKSSPVATV